MSFPYDSITTSATFAGSWSRFSDSVRKEARQLKRLLGNPQRWVKGVEATDRYGAGTDAQGTDATCWCLTGGFAALETSVEGRDAVTDAIRELYPNRWSGSVPNWNDNPSTTHADVRRVLDYVANGG